MRLDRVWTLKKGKQTTADLVRVLEEPRCSLRRFADICTYEKGLFKAVAAVRGAYRENNLKTVRACS